MVAELETTTTDETIGVGREYDDEATNQVDISHIDSKLLKVKDKEIVCFVHPNGLFGLRFKNGGAFPEELSGAYTTLRFVEDALTSYYQKRKNAENKK